MVPLAPSLTMRGCCWLNAAPHARTPFALELPRPNPVAGDLEVAFTLPRAAGAHLELMDLAGRRVASRTLGSLPAGRASVTLARAGALPSGLYWLRLTSGNNSATRKVCVAR